MTDVNAWNAVDDSNNVASPAGWPEGMMPSGVNNSARAMMGSLKRWRDQVQPTVIATGSGNAQVIIYPVAPAALVLGDQFTFYAAAANTGPVTLKVNAQAPKPVYNVADLPLVGGEIPFAGAVVSVYYDGTNFRLAGDPGALKTSGGTMTGPLTVPALTVSGNATVSGSATVSGTLAAPTLNVSGTATVGALSMPAPLPFASGGTAATTAAGAFAAIVVAASSIANPGYIKFQNGLILQWGMQAFSNVTTVAVTFPIAFPVAVFSIIVSPIMVSGGNQTCGVQGQSTTGFNLNVGNPTNNSQFWFAVGH